MRLKVIANHGPDAMCRRQDVKIVDAQTGEMLRGVQSVDIKFSVCGPHEMILTVIDFDADIECDGKVVGPKVFEPAWYERAWLRVLDVFSRAKA